RNRLVRNGEHRGPHGMAVNDAADVVERAVAGQMQLHLRGGRAAVLGVHHSAVGVDQHQVVECHVGVVHRRRRDDEVAVLPASRDVACCALDQTAPQHVLGCGQHRVLRAVHVPHVLSRSSRPRPSTSGLTIWAGAAPARSTSRSSATICACRASVFHVAPPIWGVRTTLGSATSGWSAGSHSPTKWSRPAAETLPLRSASTSASVSCSCALAVLRNTTPSRIAANCSAPIIAAVSPVTGACSEMTSASASSSSRLCRASSLYGSCAITERPSPESRHFRARPTAPRPTSPAVSPASSGARNRWYGMLPSRNTSPARTSASAGTTLLT